MARAEPTTPMPHRSGLFLAADVGYADHAVNNGTVRASARGADIRVAVGGMLMPWLALFGGYADFLSGAVDWTSGGTTSRMDDAGLDASSFFLGARGYLPRDFFVEGALGTLTERLDIGTSGQVGMIGTLGTGWEWRLRSGLALQTALRLELGRVPRQVGSAVSARQLGLYVGLGYAGDTY